MQTKKMYCVLGTYILKLSYDERKMMKEEIYCQNIVANTPFQWQVKVFVTNNMPWHSDFSKLPKS